MRSRDYGLFFSGLLLLSTSCYANGINQHKDGDSQQQGFVKKAVQGVLKHPTMQDFFKLFPQRHKKARPTISELVNPRPLSAEDNDYAEIDDFPIGPTSLTPPALPKTPRPPPPFSARHTCSAPTSPVTGSVHFGTFHSLNTLPAEKELSPQDKFLIIQWVMQPNITLRDLTRQLTAAAQYTHQRTLETPLRSPNHQAIYATPPNSVKMNTSWDVTSLLAHNCENDQATCIDSDDPIYANGISVRNSPYSKAKHAKPKSVSNPLYYISEALRSRQAQTRQSGI